MSQARGPVSTIFMKEVVDNARDRRSVLTALVTPLLGPMALVLMFNVIADAQEKAKSPKVPVVGRDNAPVLVNWLESQGVVVEAPPSDPIEAVRRGDNDVVVVIDNSFDEALRAGRPAVVEIIVDESRQQSASTVSRVRSLLSGYGRQIGALRLMLRGVDPQVGHAISVQSHDVGTAESRAAMLLAVMPLFLVMACFMGGTYVAIDVTAGERERGSIEALLLNPVPSWAMVTAKLGAVVVFGVIGVVVSVFGFVVAVYAIPFHKIGLTLTLSLSTATGVIVLLLPLVLLGSALQVAVGVVSRSFKTAQAAISFVMILPTLPGAALSVFPQQPTVGLMAIPTVGHNILMTRLIRGESIEAWQVLIATAGVVVVAAVCVAVSVKLFGPRLVVGR